MENKSLKKEIDCLSKDLSKWFGSRWVSQKFTLNRNGIDYMPKKGMRAFIPKNTTFAKAHVQYEEEHKFKHCHICKTRVEVNHKCKNKKIVSFDASYVFKKDSKGVVCAKFVGLPISSTKKKAIWVPKALVTNIQAPKQVWVPKSK
jgi:hypothetical protein